ncbi:uncharacterized protein PSFLO_00769 [Pseudozyma flocculosa]|uniref:Uncharacterized protein n=1 Tax=Pseudozyma flocculosa TaxID=84751 RepID=A0A5C3ESQ8_9BASI|nr:uncharacterized protein PSFLO_00769 [Pseudozyma flocculosa]
MPRALGAGQPPAVGTTLDPKLRISCIEVRTGDGKESGGHASAAMTGGPESRCGPRSWNAPCSLSAECRRLANRRGKRQAQKRAQLGSLGSPACMSGSAIGLRLRLRLRPRPRPRPREPTCFSTQPVTLPFMAPTLSGIQLDPTMGQGGARSSTSASAKQHHLGTLSRRQSGLPFAPGANQPKKRPIVKGDMYILKTPGKKPRYKRTAPP